MFNIFKKNDPAEEGKLLAQQAIIETVYEAGRIDGLMIVLNGDCEENIRKLKNPKFRIGFMGLIENRIKQKDYSDPNPLMDYGLITPESNDTDLSNLTRAVVSENYEPIFGWS
jgi:hypothetical protein